MNLGLNNQLEQEDVTELTAEDMHLGSSLLEDLAAGKAHHIEVREDKKPALKRVAKILTAMATSFQQAQDELEAMHKAGAHPSQKASIGGMPLKDT